MTVSLLGGAMTPFGARAASLLELFVEAGRDCLADANLDPAAVDRLVTTQSGGTYENRGGLPGAVASALGLEPAYAVGVEQTSAAGAAGVLEAWQAIRSGAADVVLVVGAERMTHRSTADVTDRVSAITHPETYKHGVTIPAFAGLTARRYLERFDAPREALARVAVKNHAHGVYNTKAHFRRAIDLETVLESPLVADPLRLYDFCPISDGGAAVCLCSSEFVRARDSTAPTLAGIAGATDTHVVHERPDLTAMDAVARAGRAALGRAGYRPADVDVCELHDMFTILELLQLEALGLAERGAAWRLVEAGETTLEGSLPVNPSGGLKSKGHPIAASGIAQLVELLAQLRGEAGERQVDADVALACNVGGFGNCAICTVLEAV